MENITILDSDGGPRTSISINTVFSSDRMETITSLTLPTGHPIWCSMFDAIFG